MEPSTTTQPVSPFEYLVKAGDSLAGILLKTGLAQKTSQAAKMAVDVAKANGLEVFDINGWAKFTGVDAKKILAKIQTRFGTTPPRINFIHIEVGDTVSYDGTTIKIVQQSEQIEEPTNPEPPKAPLQTPPSIPSRVNARIVRHYGISADPDGEAPQTYVIEGEYQAKTFNWVVTIPVEPDKPAQVGEFADPKLTKRRKIFFISRQVGKEIQEAYSTPEKELPIASKEALWSGG